jgi:rhomboid protease GluP
MNTYLPILYVTVLYGAFMAAVIQIRTQASSVLPPAKSGAAVLQLPRATLVLTAAITVSTLLQFVFPAILILFRRDAGAFLAGDWWRIITPLFVQDGGVSGSIFNLASLFLVGSLAEQLWGSRRWLVIFFVGGILSEAIALAWQPVGAGNSVANFALAGSIAVACLTSKPGRPAHMAAGLALVSGILLLLLRDIHGAATGLGAVIALALIWLDHRRRSYPSA